MGAIHCLFARPSTELHQLLLAEPTLREHVYLLPRCEGLDLKGKEGLTVVRVPAPPEQMNLREIWTSEEVRSSGLAAAFSRFDWLSEALPLPEPARWIWALSQATGARLAWFYWFERGDDLYADAALVFDPTAPRPLRPWLSLSVSQPERWQDVTTSRQGRSLYARATFLMGGADSACFHLDATGEAEPWSGSPLFEAMDHLGIEARTEYFVPEDQSRFDWERYRLREP